MPAPWHNLAEPTDVDNDGVTNTVDLAHVVAAWIEGKSGPLDPPTSSLLSNTASPSGPNVFLDVNADNVFNSVDLAAVVEQLINQVQDPQAIFSIFASDSSDPTDPAKSSFNIGETIFIHVFADDERDKTGDQPDPGLLGLLAGAFDLTYDAQASLVVTNTPPNDPSDFAITFGDDYQTIPGGSSDASTPGLIENIEAAQTLFNTPLGGDPIHFVTVEFTAAQASPSVTFDLTESDDSPVTALFPPGALPSNEIEFSEVSIAIVGSPGAPTANPDQDSTDEDTAIDIDVLSNDSDNDPLPADPITTVDATSAEGATLTENPDGTINYNPVGSPSLDALNDGESIDDTFTYEIEDQDGLTASATVTVTVSGVNDAPVAVDDNGALGTDEDTPINVNVLSNDTDVDDLPSSLSITSFDATTALGGTVTLVGNELQYDPTSSATLDAMNVGDSMTDTFTYTIEDPGGLSDTATVSISVDGVNDPPVAVDDSRGTDKDTAIDIDVIDNDTDVDNSPGELSVSNHDTTSAEGATITLNGDGTLNYDPTTSSTLQALGAGDSLMDTFTYTVSDTEGGTDTATVTINVAGENIPPVAVDDQESTDEDTAIDIDVLSNDSDPDGTLAGLTISNDSISSQGVPIVQNPDGTLGYDPTSVASVQALDDGDSVLDTFSYTIEDPNGGTDSATVEIDLTGLNDVPVATGESYNVTPGMTLSINAASGVLVNDTDADAGDLLTAQMTSGTSDGVVNLNADGSFTYTPDIGFTGTDSFTYVANDGDADSNEVTVTFNVAEMIDPIVQFTLQTTTLAGVPIDRIAIGQSFLLRVSVEDLRDVVDPTFPAELLGVASPTLDISYNSALASVVPPLNFSSTYSAVSGGDLSTPGLINDARGAATEINGNTLGGDPILFFTLQFTGQAEGDIFFTGMDNGNPSEVIAFQFPFPPETADASEVDFGQAMITVIDGTPPDAVDDNASTDEDTAIDINVLSNDSDPDGTGVPEDDLTITGFQMTTALGATVTQVDGSTLQYDPTTSSILNALPASQSLDDTFSYSVEDADRLPGTATVTVNVTGGINDRPIAEDDFANTDQSTAISIDVLSNDSDIDTGDTLSISSFDSLSVEGATITQVGDELFYDPATSASLQGLDDGEFLEDTFTYTIMDQAGASSTATVHVTVAGISDQGMISGVVYFDVDNDGMRDPNEKTIGGAQVLLTGTTFDGSAVGPITAATGGDGVYSFEGLARGTYTVTQLQPEFTIDGAEEVGTLGVDPTVTPVNDVFVINLPRDGTATDYNFAERGLTSDFISNGDFVNSNGTDGIAFAVNNTTGQQWFSLLGSGWEGIVHAEISVATDLSSVTITVEDDQGNAFATAIQPIRPEFRFLGTNSQGYVAMISGSFDDFDFTQISNGNGVNLNLDPDAVDAVLSDDGID